MARQKISPWGFVGMGGMACIAFLILGTAGIAPWWVSLLLGLFWLVLLLVATRWFLARPTWVPWLPVVGFLVWCPTIVLGTSQLGWR